MIPANNGVATLVPQTVCHPLPSKLRKTSTGWLHDALSEMSGTPRREPTTAATLFWYAGLLKKIDLPPPLAAGEPGSFHTRSGTILLPRLFRRRLRPPTAVTSGSLAGQDVTG